MRRFFNINSRVYSFFIITFIIPISIIGQYSVVVAPSNATANDILTITFTDFDVINDFYTDGQDPIYMYSGVQSNGSDWQFVHGDINDTSTLGQVNATTNVGEYEITIDPKTYYGLTDGTSVEGLNLIFINQWGPGGNNQTTNLFIDLIDATIGSSIVTLTPTFPTADEVVTIDFDATGTNLDGASEIYIHSGVSTNLASPQAFDYVVGNWGQNDGIGQMTNISGNMWQISLPSLRSFYSVPDTEDIFGINFLFRNAAGDQVVNNTGNNYHYPADPEDYFIIFSPSNQAHTQETNNALSVHFETSGSIANWTIDEVDASNNHVINIDAQTGGSTFTSTLNSAIAESKYYRITCDFGSVSKYKIFEVIWFTEVTESPRPPWTKPGINYHTDDPTKATLVLHAPTYTRYFSGTGALTGSNTTAPKSVVHVIGDFNNWEVTESFKLNRDRDGWDGSIDADGDNDHGDYWWIELDGLTPGQEYVFQYLIDGTLQVADPYTEKVSDPEDGFISNNRYPNLIAYPSAAIDRASVLQTGQTDYVWTAPDFTRPTDNNLNIYELHFRDFTNKGTYLSAISKLDYLKALGINAIHVLPVSEFEGNSSWGYNPNFYFAPDKYYGTREDLKTFIDECHKREIQVFNDIVLNHAFHSNVMAKMYWNDLDNKPANDNPWMNPDHKMVAAPEGWWGADWNHESEHTQKMVDRILDYWLLEFNFDGYRFDFTKGFGQTEQDPNDPWASSFDQARIDLLFRMANGMKARNPGSVAIFEHLAWPSEDAILANQGILMWSGGGHHSKIKEFMLGWNGEDIYTTGIYNAQGFGLANWMSYMESHDEERQAYEVLHHGNGVSGTEELIDRLKTGAVFNLLFPGPRMLWEFEELGYDVSINYNGRTGEKPVRWEYFNDTHRNELWRLMSQIFHLRNTYNLYATTPDYGNLGSTNGVSEPRRMKLHDGNGKYVISIANLDPNNAQTVFPNYDLTGTWYRFNGDPMIDGTTYHVNTLGDGYLLQASESLILTNFDPQWTDDCDQNANCCVRLTLTWQGGVGNWNEASNWDLGVVPKPCDMVIIPSGNHVTIPTGETGYARHVWTQGTALLDVNGDLIIDQYK